MPEVTTNLKYQKGQSLTEMAVSMVILLVLLAGVFDIGRAVFTYMSMRDAAQEGAAYASIEPRQCTEVINRVRANLEDPTANVTVLLNGKNCSTAGTRDGCAGHEASVTVQLNFPMTMPFIGAIIGTQNIDLRATATDTVLRPYCK